MTDVGTIKLSSHITLTNVLYVPSFSFNLIFVSALTHSQPLCVVFLSNYCFIQALTCWNTIGMGKMHDGLYLLQGSSLSKALVLLMIFFSRISLVLSLLFLLLFLMPACIPYGILD